MSSAKEHFEETVLFTLGLDIQLETLVSLLLSVSNDAPRTVSCRSPGKAKYAGSKELCTQIFGTSPRAGTCVLTWEEVPDFLKFPNHVAAMSSSSPERALFPKLKCFFLEHNSKCRCEMVRKDDII